MRDRPRENALSPVTDIVSGTATASYCPSGTDRLLHGPRAWWPSPGAVCSEPFHLCTSSFRPSCHDLTWRRTQAMAVRHCSLQVPWKLLPEAFADGLPRRTLGFEATFRGWTMSHTPPLPRQILMEGTAPEEMASEHRDGTRTRGEEMRRGEGHQWAGRARRGPRQGR